MGTKRWSSDGFGAAQRFGSTWPGWLMLSWRARGSYAALATTPGPSGALRRQRPGEGDAAVDPAVELAFCAHTLGFDAQPAGHRAAAHFKRRRVWLGQQRVGL